MVNEDNVLISNIKNGDESSFDRLVVKYQKKIYYLACRLTNDHFAALDLSQTAFIKAYRSINKFQEKSDFYTWLYRITVNICLNYLKKKGRKKEVTYDDRLAASQVDLQPLPESSLQNKELQTAINEALNSLPPQQKITFILHYKEGLLLREIAIHLGSSLGTVKANLFHALQKLRKQLKDYLK